MKFRTRKLMSLVMALAIVCSMIPGAMAAFWPNYSNGYDYSNGIQQNVGISSAGGSANLTASFPLYATYNGWPVVYAGHVSWSDSTGNFTVSGSGTNATVTSSSSAYWGEGTQVTASGLYYPADQYGNIISTVPVYINQTYNVSVGGTTTVPTIGGAYYPGYDYTYPSYPGLGTNGYWATMSQSSLALTTGGSSYLAVSADTSYILNPTYTWTSSNSAVAAVSGTISSAIVTGVATGQATITATITGISAGDGTAVTTYATCLVTVNGGTGDLYLSSSSLQMQPNTLGSYTSYAALTASSINYSSLLTTTVWSSSNSSVAQVSSSTGSSIYVYAGSTPGQATITATLYSGTTVVGTATCLVTVGTASAGDITYSLTTGQSKALSVADFQTFWSNATGGTGTLTSVTFSAATGNVGKLMYTPYYSTTQATATGTFYAAPTSTSQNGIAAVSFVPTTYGTTYYTGTLSVPFTATGTTSYLGATASYSGTLVFTVTNGNVDTINYTANGGSVKLDPNDFLTVYRKAMNTTAAVAPTVYIQFQNAPAFGSLYYNYNTYGLSYGAYGTKLTSTNIGAMTFSTLPTGAYGIDDLTYVPAASGATDTVRYTVYSAAGSTPLYTGEIKFAAGSATVVKFATAPGTAVKLDLAKFAAVDALKGCSYITLSAPVGGKLYTNYVGSTGNAVTSGTSFALSATGSGTTKSINTVTLVPSLTSGTVKIPFTGTNYLNAQVTGTIEVYVAKRFPDVAANNWANEFITELAAKGIVGGDDKGNYNPKGELKYGEALKLIMEACGYSKQVKTGTHWASGYLTKAYADGLVSTTSINLDSAIDRTTIAQITAKALGLSPAYSAGVGISDPTDSSDGYVQALYNAGILNGENKGGKNYYYGSQTIIREQIAKIICLAGDYYDAYGKTSSSITSGTGAVITPSTSITGTTGTVATGGYVYVSEYGTTYHRTSSCGGFSYPIKVTVSQAEASARGACTTCFPK